MTQGCPPVRDSALSHRWGYRSGLAMEQVHAVHFTEQTCYRRRARGVRVPGGAREIPQD